MVIDRRDGKGRLYQLNPEGISALRAHFDEFWNRALGAFHAAADQTGEEDADADVTAVERRSTP